MEDLVAKPNLALFKQVQTEASKRKRTSNGHRIVRTLQASSMLFVKAYMDAGTKTPFLPEQSITYSDAPVFSASAKGKNITISFDLDSNTYVTATIANTSGTYLHTLENRVSHDAGLCQLSTLVPTSGIYVVSVSLNGKKYEKTINVK